MTEVIEQSSIVPLNITFKLSKLRSINRDKLERRMPTLKVTINKVDNVSTKGTI